MNIIGLWPSCALSEPHYVQMNPAPDCWSQWETPFSFGIGQGQHLWGGGDGAVAGAAVKARYVWWLVLPGGIHWFELSETCLHCWVFHATGGQHVCRATGGPGGEGGGWRRLSRPNASNLHRAPIRAQNAQPYKPFALRARKSQTPKYPPWPVHKRQNCPGR